MSFAYDRTIHFADTDAAGVVFFPNHLAICHEAYEESLAAAGIDLQTFFSRHEVLVPVSKSRAEYFRPLTCGDRIRVVLTPTAVAEDAYAIDYDVVRRGRPDKLAARVRTEHVCIAPRTRERRPVPPALAAWIKRCSV